MNVSNDFKKAQELINAFVLGERQLSKADLALVAYELGVDPPEALRQLHLAQDAHLKGKKPKPKAKAKK